jgi:hypothetical protein
MHELESSLPYVVQGLFGIDLIGNNFLFPLHVYTEKEKKGTF